MILPHPVRGSNLKTWALAVARRAGMRNAKVALAHKLAVVLHRILRDQTTFVARRSAPMAAQSRGRRISLREGLTVTSRSRSPFAGTMYLVRPQCLQQHPWATAPERSVGGSSANTIGQRHRSTADRSKPPAKRPRLRD